MASQQGLKLAAGGKRSAFEAVEAILNVFESPNPVWILDFGLHDDHDARLEVLPSAGQPLEDPETQHAAVNMDQFRSTWSSFDRL